MNLLWMDEIRHHFREPWDTIVCWYFQGNRVIPGFLRWCEMDFATIHGIDSLCALRCPERMNLDVVAHCPASNSWTWTKTVWSRAPSSRRRPPGNFGGSFQSECGSNLGPPVPFYPFFWVGSPPPKCAGLSHLRSFPVPTRKPCRLGLICCPHAGVNWRQGVEPLDLVEAEPPIRRAPNREAPGSNFG